MGDVASSSALLLAAVFAVSGIAKLADPDPLALALKKILPRRLALGSAARRRLRLVSLAVAALEVAIVPAVLLATGAAARAVAAAVVGLGTVFVAAVVAAIRKGAACGCWGSLSDGPAGGAELVRAAGVAVLGAVILVDPGRPEVGLATVAVALLLAAAWALAAGAAARLLPTPARHHRVSAPSGGHDRLRRAVVDFLRGPGGADRRRRPPRPPGALDGREREHVLDRVGADIAVQEALAIADDRGGLDWSGARVARIDPSQTAGVAVNVAGPAGWLRVVQAPDGSVAVVARLGGTSYLGAEGRLLTEAEARQD